MVPRVAHVICKGGVPIPARGMACLERKREGLSPNDMPRNERCRLRHRKRCLLKYHLVQLRRGGRVA